MGHGTSDAVMEFLQVGGQQIEYRLGVEFRLPTAVPPLGSLLPARYLRVQVTSPPPDRVDGSRWFDGLRVRDGSPGGRVFNPADRSWQSPGGVFPVPGTSPLAQPRPETLVYDGWITANAVAPSEALATCFDLIPTDSPTAAPLNHFISISYEPLPVAGQKLSVVGVNYYRRDVLDLTRPIDGYCAVCLGTNFYPAGRNSAEYIVVDGVTSFLPNGVQFSGPRVW